MKKTKLTTILLFSILPLLLISITACSKASEPKKAETQSKEEKAKAKESTAAKEEKKPTKENDVEVKVEETEKEEKPASKEKEDKNPEEKKAEDQKEETDKKKETKEESKETDKKDSPKSKGNLGFSDSETKKLRDLVNKIGMTIIESDNQEHSTVPVEGLEAIASFDNKDSYGWICKYQDNKIGVAQIYKNSPIEVVRIFGEEAIFQDTDGLIENNNPEMYKKASERIEKTFFPKGTKIERLY